MQRLEDPIRLDNLDQMALLCDVSANTRLDSLSDLITHKADLRVRGGPARKVSVIDARRFARYRLLRCWNSQMDALAPGLICSRCDTRGAYLKATKERARARPVFTG